MAKEHIWPFFLCCMLLSMALWRSAVVVSLMFLWSCEGMQGHSWVQAIWTNHVVLIVVMPPSSKSNELACMQWRDSSHAKLPIGHPPSFCKYATAVHANLPKPLANRPECSPRSLRASHGVLRNAKDIEQLKLIRGGPTIKTHIILYNIL